MIADITKYSNHYSVLALLVSACLLLFVIVWPDALLQMLVVVFAVGAYVCWGIIHHHLIGDLKSEIVLEYLIIGVLVLSVFWSMLLA
jgi:hypothetical protein